MRHKLVQKIILAYDKYERENTRREAERRGARRDGQTPKKYHRPAPQKGKNQSER